MTYAKLILPYNPTDNQLKVDPKAQQSLKGKLKTAFKKAGATLKNAVENPGDTMKNLGKYLQQNEDKLVNKFASFIL